MGLWDCGIVGRSHPGGRPPGGWDPTPSVKGGIPPDQKGGIPSRGWDPTPDGSVRGPTIFGENFSNLKFDYVSKF